MAFIYTGVASGSRVIHQVVPQGSVLYPTLFNTYVSDFSHTAGLSSSYTDDFTASTSHPNDGKATPIMANHAVGVETWAGEKELQISAQKPTVTFFTLETQQERFHPLIPVGGDLLPLDRTPKILGVTFDPHSHIHKHVGAIEEKAMHRLFLIKSLTGTTTYTALIDFFSPMQLQSGAQMPVRPP